MKYVDIMIEHKTKKDEGGTGMRLVEARKVINQQIDLLDARRSKIQKMLEDCDKTEHNQYDRVELTKELKILDKAYEVTSFQAQRVHMMDMAIQNAEASKQQAEREAKKYKEMMKCLEVFRRIAKGDRVPMEDEQRLMGHDVALYMMAKNMAMLSQKDDEKNHDSLWKNEVQEEQPPTPQEVADQANISIDLPEMSESTMTESGGESLT